MAPPRKSKNEEALMAFAPVKRRQPSREEFERGNVRYSMLNMMATGNPLVPKYAPWGSSSRPSSSRSEPIVEFIDRRGQRNQRIEKLTESWVQATGDPTLPKMLVERLDALRVGQEQEFTVTQDGKKSHGVKMTRRVENGEDLIQIFVSMGSGDTASSDTPTKPEKAKKETKGSNGKSSTSASADKEDEAAAESTASAEGEGAKQKDQGKKGKGKGKAAAPEPAPGPTPEAAPEASAAAPGAQGEWTQAQDDSVLKMKEAGETWANIAKQVGKGKSDVQKRYKELVAAKNEPATSSNDNAKQSPAKSPNKNQDGTIRSPGGPAPGFPPPVLPSPRRSNDPYVMDPRHAYYQPPAAMYHSGYAPFPPRDYHYFPPRPEYYHPYYPPSAVNPYYSPPFVNNNYNYLPMHGAGAYMGARSDNHSPTEDAHGWLLEEGPAVKYMSKNGKRIVLIRCYSGDRIRINDHVLEEPPNGWRNDKHSSSRPLRYEISSIHARCRSDSSIWVMGSEIDAPGSGWGHKSEGCKIWTHREGKSQGSGTSPKQDVFATTSNSGENQNSGSPVLGDGQGDNGSQNGRLATNDWADNANTNAQDADNNANSNGQDFWNSNADNSGQDAWDNSGNDNTQNAFDVDNKGGSPTNEWDANNNDNIGDSADPGNGTDQFNFENLTDGVNKSWANGGTAGEADNNNQDNTNNGSVHSGSPAKNSDTAAPADDWPSNLPRSFLDPVTVDWSRSRPEDELLFSPKTRALLGHHKSSTHGGRRGGGKGKQPSTGKDGRQGESSSNVGGKNGGSKIGSDTATHVPGSWNSSPNEAENEGGNNDNNGDAGASSWGDTNADAGASSWQDGTAANAGASNWDGNNGASGGQSGWDDTNNNNSSGAGASQW